VAYSQEVNAEGNDVICAACATENEPGRKFCGECGAALALGCPSCGASNGAQVKFCGECGTALGAHTPVVATTPPAAEPTAERRLVSVLFADLVGFTTLSESRDSEEVRELLSRYFDTCRRLIELYGGTVEKFIGDAVMAVWGTPVATEDDAERAVRAALDLVAAVSSLGDEVGMPDLRARAGVLTGEAAVTLGATGEGMVAGDIVNTASRVQSVADPGTVLVGESTKRTTEQTVAYADAGSHELKGKIGLVPLYRALRVVSGARGTLKSTGLEAPFVGRDRELRQIKDFFHTSADEGKAHLVSITGIAGIGKSRLAWEFYKYFDGLPQSTYWHRGRCLAYGEGVTYWALADMVRMRARITEDEDPISALEKLVAVVEEHLPDAEERRFVEPRLAHLLALEEGRYERDDLFAAWRLFFERLADVYPTVLAFEDMQWADASLLDFIEYLLEWSRNSPIYVLTLARPELLERRPTWGAAKRNFTSIYLEPLSETAMGALLSGLVPGLPDGLRTQILARAEGIPLYAVETVRMLLDRGALVQDGSIYRLTGALEALEVLEVPETLQALIAARLDGLPAEERRVIQDAAVLGKTFTKQALAALSGVAESELDIALTSLTRKEVLGVQSDPRSPEHGQYGFLQDLLRKVAYETLAKADRKARHLAAAAQLEEGWSEHEVIEVVASHYLAAYHAAPDADDAPAIRAKAGERLAGAGERAASLGANEEAERYFAQAAELDDDVVKRASLHEQAGLMAWRGARSADARALLEGAATVFENEGLIRRAARVSSVLADIDFRDGHPPAAVARLEATLEALESTEPDEVVAEVAAQLGRFLVLNREYEKAAPRLEVALALAEALALPEVFAQALTSKSIFYTYRNRLEEGRILLEGALARALASDLHAAAMRAYNNLAVVFESCDRYVPAVDLSDRALELARRVGDRVWEGIFLGGPISGLVMLGRWDEALARAATFDDLGGHSIDATLKSPLVDIYCQRGDLPTAQAWLDENAALRTDDEDIQSRVAYVLAKAQTRRAQGSLLEALELAEEVLTTETLGITFLTTKLGLVEALESAFALEDTGKVRELVSSIDALRPGERPPLLDAHAHRFRGKLDRDEDEFAAAADRFRELSLRFWVAVTLLEHGELLAESGRDDEAKSLLGEARGIFEELGARPWLDRVDAQAEVRA
jgi:class 3 adenylate cyclase/tetratricopeptide (TPR) repeat protein